MNVFIRWFVIAFMLAGFESTPLMLLLEPNPVVAAVQEEEDEDEEDEDDEDEEGGGTYESDEYGFSVSYDEDWEIGIPSQGVDVNNEPVESIFFVLRGDRALAVFNARRGDLAADACVQGLARYWPVSQDWLFDVNEINPREGDNGESVEGGGEGDAFGVFDFEYQWSGEEEEGTIYIRCQRFQSDEALLLTSILYFDQDDYDDDEEIRERLLDGVHLP